MARVANRFTNPANDNYYDWVINHQEEEDVGLGRSIEPTASTSGVGGLVIQQGADDPMVLSYRGTILEEAQHEEFIDWSNLCKTQTIVFKDFAGEEYEVLMTYRSRRERVAHNPRGGTAAPLHIWRFSMTMHVVQALSGAWA